jgi:hypothetical protein
MPFTNRILICQICFQLLRVGKRLMIPRNVFCCAFCGRELEEPEDERP